MGELLCGVELLIHMALGNLIEQKIDVAVQSRISCLKHSPHNHEEN